MEGNQMFQINFINNMFEQNIKSYILFILMMKIYADQFKCWNCDFETTTDILFKCG